MLSEQEIKQALRASRVAPLAVPNPHGPFGWNHLAHALAGFLGGNGSRTNVVKSLEIPAQTWEKLESLADEATRTEARPVSISEVATAILERYVSEAR
jgi:hypothetical protein